MRFTSVGPKWRAALRSCLLSLSLPSPSCPLGCRPPPPPFCRVRLSVRSSVAISLLLPLTRGLRGTAQTAGMHQMHRADRYPSPFHRFHLFTSAVCLFPSLLPVSLLVSPSRSFASFFSARLLRLRGPLSHPLHRCAAAAVATPGYGPLSTTGVVARLFSSTPSWYVRLCTHATRVDRYAEEARCVVVGDTYRVVHRDAFSLRAFSRPPVALSLSLFPSRGEPSPLAFFAVSFDRASFYAPVPG